MKIKQGKLLLLVLILTVLYYHSQYLPFSGVEGKRIPVDGWLFLLDTLIFDVVFLFIYYITEKKEHDKILYGVYFIGVNFIGVTSKTSALSRLKFMIEYYVFQIVVIEEKNHIEKDIHS